MKRNHYIILLIVFAASGLASCKKDFLDVKKIPADMPIDLMYKRYDYIQGIVWNALQLYAGWFCLAGYGSGN